MKSAGDGQLGLRPQLQSQHRDSPWLPRDLDLLEKDTHITESNPLYDLRLILSKTYLHNNLSGCHGPAQWTYEINHLSPAVPLWDPGPGPSGRFGCFPGWLPIILYLHPTHFLVYVVKWSWDVMTTWAPGHQQPALRPHVTRHS